VSVIASLGTVLKHVEAVVPQFVQSEPNLSETGKVHSIEAPRGVHSHVEQARLA
jgi:hypothetical protein